MLAMRGIRKSFGSVDVLKGVDFAVRPGEIHALMGENGAGKSTLMKIAGRRLSGLRRRDPDRWRPGAVLRPARRRGHRHRDHPSGAQPGAGSLAWPPTFFSAASPSRSRFSSTSDARPGEAAALLERLNFRASPEHAGQRAACRRAAAGRDRQGAVAQRQDPDHGRADLRALGRRGASAARDHAPAGRRGRRDRLHLAPDGGDLRALADRVTVLRDGVLAGNSPVGETSRRELIRMMAGREVQEFFDRGAATAAVTPKAGTDRPPVLSVRDLWLANPVPTAIRPRLRGRGLFRRGSRRGARVWPG